MKKKRWWISWVQPTKDYRPITTRRPDGFIDWWCSGEDPEGNAILCALVEAESRPAAIAMISNPEMWPESNSYWRFVEEKPNGWEPGERFTMR